MKTHGMRWMVSKRIASAAIGVGLLAAMLALPPAASAADDDHSTHRYYSDEMAHVRGHIAESRQLEPTAFMPQDQCRTLEQNIAEYDCGVELAKWAGSAELVELPAAPDGVNHLFWEENVLNFAVSGPTFEGDEDPQPLFPEADDVAQQGAGVVNY